MMRLIISILPLKLTASCIGHSRSRGTRCSFWRLTNLPLAVHCASAFIQRDLVDIGLYSYAGHPRPATLLQVLLLACCACTHEQDTHL